MINITYQVTEVLEPVRPLTRIAYPVQKRLDRPMRFLVLQHEHHEGPGIYGELAQEKGIELEFVNVRQNGYRIPQGRELKHFDGALIMGGSYGVNDSASEYPSKLEEIEFIQGFEGPILGHCLGSQLVSYARGGTVGKGHVKECGFYGTTLTERGTRSRIMRGVPREFMMFHWHGDYLRTPPAGAVILASSKNYEIQAFQIGNRIGILGHPEVRQADIESLFQFDMKWFSEGNHGNTREQIMADATNLCPVMNRQAAIIFDNFISMAQEQ